MPRSYESPPLTEAVVEFHFVPGMDWDPRLADGLFDRFRVAYPVRRQLTAFEGSFRLGTTELTQEIRPVPRVQFWRDDESSLVQISPSLLTVNHLRPYQDWSVFRPQVLEAVATYRDVAAPGGLATLAVSYLNTISLPQEFVTMEDYFNLYPELKFPEVDGLAPNLHGPFLLALDFPFENFADVLRVQLAPVPSEPGTGSMFSFTLRYETGTERVSFDTLDDVLDEAHQHLEDVFEACITDLLRSEFGERR